MSARASLALITVGAILTFAVRAQPSFLDLHVTGLILIAVGLIRPLVAGWSSLAARTARREGERSAGRHGLATSQALGSVERGGTRRGAEVPPPVSARHPGRQGNVA